MGRPCCICESGDNAVLKDLRDISHQLIRLEELEESLAIHYGMVGSIDPTAVRTAARRVGSKLDGFQFDRDLQQLHKLHDLRVQCARIGVLWY